MRNINSKNAPASGDLVQDYIDTAYDNVKLVADNLTALLLLSTAISNGDFDDLIASTDIDTLVELNAIVADATLIDGTTLGTAAYEAATAFATAAEGALAASALQSADVNTLAKLNALVADATIASQTYVDLAVAGLYEHKGSYDASTNTPDLDTTPSGIKKADTYTVSVAGTFFTAVLAAGDLLIADQDDPTLESHWTIVNRNIDEGAFATAAEGALAASAVQPADNISTLTNDAGYTDDQTGAEIKIAYEGELDTNAFTDAEKTSLGTMEDNAKDDQTDAEIETAYNNQVVVVSQANAEAGTSTVVQRWTPQRVGQAIAALGGGGGATRLYKAVSYTASTGEVIFVDSAEGTYIITLPPTPNTEDYVTVLDCGANALINNITIARNGQTIAGSATDFVIDLNSGGVNFIFNGTTWEVHPTIAQATVGDTENSIIASIALSDETTALAADTAVATFHMPPWATTLSDVVVGMTTAPTGASAIFDLNEAGVSVLSTKVTVDVGEFNSEDASIPCVVSDSSLAANAKMTVDIDQVGSTVAGAGAKIYLIGRRA